MPFQLGRGTGGWAWTELVSGGGGRERSVLAKKVKGLAFV